MIRTFAIAAILAAFAFASAFAADQPTARNHDGLTCFSIMSSEAAKSLPADRQSEAQRGWIAQASCDDMCAARGAACVTTEGYSGVNACADVPPSEVSIPVCRCCATRN